MSDNRLDPKEVALRLIAEELLARRRNRDSEILAMRLILAYLGDDTDETAYLVWAIQDESGCSRDQFQVAARAAREAASWWKEHGEVEQARARILAKLDKLTGVAA